MTALCTHGEPLCPHGDCAARCTPCLIAPWNWRAAEKLAARWSPLLDAAALLLVNMGYTARVTQVVQSDGIGGRRVLVLDAVEKDGRIVGGREVFEVVTAVEQVDWTFTFTHTLKWLWREVTP